VALRIERDVEVSTDEDATAAHAASGDEIGEAQDVHGRRKAAMV